MDSEPRLTRRQSHDESRHFLAGTCSLPSAPIVRMVLTSLGLAAVLFTGCDKNQLASLDSTNSAPLISQLLFSPDSVYLDALTPTNGEYTVTTTVRAKATDNDGAGDIAAVTADIIMADGSLAASGIALHDDGVAPDSVAGDGIFSGLLQFQLTRAQAGKWQIRVSAVDHRGALSNALSGQLKLARHNARPSLSDLVVPDSVDLPVTGYTLVNFTVVASDSDGLSDIQLVYFRRLEPFDSAQTRFFMKDDGGADPPVTIGGISVSSGDDVAGDGRFSFLIPLLSTSTRRTNVFGFQAIDSFGDTSITVAHSFTVR